MMRSMFDSTSIPVLQEMIHFAQARHEVLAGNVANMNVPGYRVRDLSPETFQERLKEALDDRKSGDRGESPGILGREPDSSMKNVRESLKSILYHDDTDVGMEQQVSEMSKNQFFHNLSISVMNAQFRILQSAVTERI